MQTGDERLQIYKQGYRSIEHPQVILQLIHPQMHLPPAPFVIVLYPPWSKPRHVSSARQRRIAVQAKAVAMVNPVNEHSSQLSGQSYDEPRFTSAVPELELGLGLFDSLSTVPGPLALLFSFSF